MKTPTTFSLHDLRVAVDFYDCRYERGYMESCPDQKRQRVFELVRALDLPAAGEALDLGCGNGVLTDVIRQALPPRWRVYGADISTHAIDNARRRYPKCHFFVMSDRSETTKKWDLLFTNHVLEHAYDAAELLHQAASCLKDTSVMLHILPCGNQGSFEHSTCALHQNGIDSERGNCFFIEEEAHLRRLSTDQLESLCAAEGFGLTEEYYSNHYHGAVDWITGTLSPGVILELTDSRSAVNEDAAATLHRLRRRLLLYWVLRVPATAVNLSLYRKTRRLKHYVALAVALPFCLFAKPMDNYLKHKAECEWQEKRGERNGSEMYLVFRRTARTALSSQ